ncbi:prephenate dehydrogenase [Halobacillus andaensis]|uniref:Prephenate dehydrogenase n=1 Tax=Halobacillus andaensis TaxID=1176239 RepID=A0A917B0E1_HALAA|nr:prephenate dehydrogenase [Halobacillus andaensis]MBP2003274.1 prephenate dehydrogenase [Halobacillus andaensis]GGF09433.1 prephenate dehydrogenase [Halobacillus andaensis]
MTQTVFIVGLGLIGGSIAMNVAKKKECKVIALDPDPKTIDMAKIQGVIYEEAKDFKSGCQQADILILATPISVTIDYLQQLNDCPLEKPLLVTDVSSVKNNVLEAANVITNDQVTFVGGHPMAGSHKQGYSAAKPHLFENAIYVLTPSKTSNGAQAKRLQELLEETKARFITLSTKEHDEMTAVISHFPHLIASSLVHQAKEWQKTHPYLEHLAAGGFRDITRIASSNPTLWQDIFFQNRTLLIQMLGDWIDEMQELQSLLQDREAQTTYEYLLQAKQYRDGLPAKEKGAIPAFYDLYVDIHDQPGAIYKVIQQLAETEISIKNIEILEIREGITGVLRISFSSSKEQKMSYDLLSSRGYEVMIEE